MHQPAARPRPGRRRRPRRSRRCWRARSPAHAPVTSTLAARCTTASCPRAAPATAARSATSARTSRRPQPRGAPLQHGDVVAALRAGRGRRRPEHAARAGDQHPHGRPTRPPASTRSAQRATRARSTLDACRMSTGRAGGDQHRGHGHPGGGADGGGEAGTGQRPAGGGLVGRRAGASPAGTTTTTTCWVPAGPTPTHRGRGHGVERLDPLLDPDRGERPVGGRDDVHQPALHPQPARRRRGARRRRCGASRGRARSRARWPRAGRSGP